ncbi:MAG: alanine racemase [Sedimentisphaerales bacterium]|nr:alanine racemase [Sedimentisphaerales bacterium]
MDSQTRQGSLKYFVVTPVPKVAGIYEVGPLRLKEHALKTVKAYISRSHLRHNALQIKARCRDEVKLCAVVKANGYGHEARTVVSCLNDLADYFAVSTIEEAEQIYPFVLSKPILVTCPLFGGMDEQIIRLAQIRGFHCTTGTMAGLEYVQEYLNNSLPPLNIHLKVDTGMGRIGCLANDASVLIQKIRQCAKLRLSGIYSHFACANDDIDYTRRQLTRFDNLLHSIGLAQDTSVIKHIANTSATLCLQQSHYDMVRCGIGLYGYRNFEDDSVEPIDFRPVLRLEAPLVQVKSIPAGHSCGYGRGFVAPRDMVIGIVPIGYADGLFRCLSNRAMIRHDKYNLPIVGRISMDFTIIDLSELPEPAEGMGITIIDDNPQSPCSAVNLARLANTIPYEIFTAIGNRIKRETVV